VKNQVQLTTYVDRLGGTLNGLRALLEGPLSGLFGGVHLLPFFHPIDGADAGFDPIDHLRVDERLGTWDDVAAISHSTEVMADVIVNHVSSRSMPFRDFVTNGDRSEFAGMFLTLDRVFPQGASKADLNKIYRPRPGPPFTPMELADGSCRQVWTTFSAEQIDIDVAHPCAIEYLDSILDTLAANGVTTIRLDAVGYAIKKPGTRCFMIDETFAFIDELTARARARGLQVLVEVHSHFRQQIEIAARVDRVYDFALPPLLLHTLFTGSARALHRWVALRPTNAVTVLDTHDGIGVIDIGADGSEPGLLQAADLDRLVDRIHLNSDGQSRQATGAAAANLDLYQVNCTFYDALGRDDQDYLLARALQFFLPGVPQVYYVGLLAGENDMALLRSSGVGRDINRHYYDRAEIDRAMERPVVARLFELIRLRNRHPAFLGEFESLDTDDERLGMRWRNGDEFAQLNVNLRTREHRLAYSEHGREMRFQFA
jgi:sucrose phosphorylase